MEVKNGEEPELPSKRSADLSPSTTAAATSTPIVLKKQKLETPEEGENKNSDDNPAEEQTVGTATESKIVEEEKESVVEGEVELEDEGNSNGKAVIDRKGKGILIEEDEDEEDDEEEDGDSDDDDDSSDGGKVSDGGDDSDFADDPLTEVDLDNILPSRTRRRVVHPGAYISNDLGGADDEDDDSDDSEA